jgi:hypothetical protein
MARKRSEKEAKTRASIAMAVKEFQTGKYKSVNACVTALGVSATTLRARLNGRGTHVETNEPYQLLTNAEEKMLAKRCTELTQNGVPPRKTTIKEMAAEIQLRHARKINDEEEMELVRYPPIGKEWV